MIPLGFLQVNTQPEVGNEAYDWGATRLHAFFREQLVQFLEPDLAPLARRIIDCFLSQGTVEDYEQLLPAGSTRT